MANEGLLKFDWPVEELAGFTADILKPDSSTRQSGIAFSDADHLGRYKNTTSISTIVAGDSVKLYLAGDWVSTEPYQPEATVINLDAIGNNVWNSLLTGTTFNIPTSAGRRLRTIASAVIRDDDLPAQTGINNNNQIKFDSGASDSDGAYDPARVCIVGGDGIGQSRLILEYDGDNKVATLDRNWKINPVEGDEFIIYADAGREHVNEGLARGGDTLTITLNELASDADNTYRNQGIFIRSGVGEDQVRRVVSYDGTSKIATVAHSWDTIPDATSGYVMLPATCVEVQAIKGQELGDNVGVSFNKVFENEGEVTAVVIDDIGNIKTQTDKLNNMIEEDSGGNKFTVKALENAPGRNTNNIEHHTESIVGSESMHSVPDGEIDRESDPSLETTNVDRATEAGLDTGTADDKIVQPTVRIDRESNPKVQGD